MLNSSTLKDYFCDGRLVPLSKVKGEDYVDPGEIRPIMVRSHLSKTAEKAITASIEASHKHHLSTGAYQSTSRRAVASTHINISEVITTSGSEQYPRSKLKHVLFVDLTRHTTACTAHRFLRSSSSNARPSMTAISCA
jgi:hypothetical protein